MIINKKFIYIFFTLAFFVGSFFIFANKYIFADAGKNILISEAQIGGVNSNDEFIELYNSSDSNVDLTGWSLKRKTSAGTISNIISNMEGIAPASGYVLIAPRANCGDGKNETCYKGTVGANFEYTTNSYLAKDNAILLYDKNDVLIDKLGWGGATDFEGKVFSENPQNSFSLERKKKDGIVQDTDNNQDDFFIQNIPNPQSAKLIALDQEAGNSPSPSPANTNQPNPSPSPSSSILPSTSPLPSTPFSPSPSPSSSNTNQKIIITEFLLDPKENDSDNESIEIYNDGSSEVDLSGWTISDKAGSVKKYAISKASKIKSGEYKIFYSSETGISLNNSGDGVILKDNSEKIIDETPISDAAKEGVSYALADNGTWKWTMIPTPGNKNIIKEKENAIPKNTLLEEAKTETQNNEKKPDAKTEVSSVSGVNNISEDKKTYDFSDGLIINEVLPNPEGSDDNEWIEIYNESDKDVNMEAWQIDDVLQKGSKPYTIKNEKIIKAKSYLVFYNEETKIIFNNSGDEANLLWPDGTVVDNVKYGKSKEGYSYSLGSNEAWGWTRAISPGGKNIVEAKTSMESKVVKTESDNDIKIEEVETEVEDKNEESAKETINIESEKESYIEIGISEAKKLPKYAKVKVAGIVSAPPGIYSDQLFYISGSGIQIFGYGIKLSDLAIGDKVEVSGMMSEIGGEKRIIVEEEKNIKVISHDNLLKPDIISTGDVGEKFEGYLISAEGKVSKIEEDIFYIDDGSGEAKVYIKPETKIEKPEIKVGKYVAVTGQVSRTSLGYRVLPRFQGDIKLGKIASASTLAESSEVKLNDNEEEKNIPFLYYIFAIAGGVVLIDWGRMRFKK